MSHAYASSWVDLAAIQLIICALLTLMVRGHSIMAASWLLLASFSVSYGLVVLAHPQHMQPALAVPVVILAQALLGGWRSFVLTTLLWVAGVGAQSLGGAMSARSAAWASLPVLFGTWGTTWLTSRQLRLAIRWALGGWERAENMLKETRDRRGDLYRALRALEEATYRIERMNSELLYARSEAERARAFKDHYATTISHELRGPLSLILGFSRLMALSPERYGGPLPAPYYADVDAVYRNAQHLSALLDDILDLAQIEAERLPLIKNRLDIARDVCATAVEIVRPLAERKGLSIEPLLEANLPEIVADGVRLRQVLLNLLTNAVRHTSQGGITVTCKREQEHVLISVSDTGSGIAPEHMPRIFEEFYQPSSMGGRQGSSGLGLSISKQLVELHGGRMWVESVPGQGTTFSLTVPLPGVMTLLGPGTNLPDMGTAGARPNRAETGICLVLHTSARVARILSRYLEGYRVIAMDDDEQALSIVDDLHPISILVPTAKMGQIAAFTSGRGHQVPIIGCDFPEASADSQLDGVLAQIVKPVSAEILASLMRKVERNGQTTILLADDEPDFVRLMEGVLMALPRPYRIQHAYDGEQALERMRERIPDVVFLDLAMPRMGGAEVIRAMRADPQLCNVPVIILSAQEPADQGLFMRTPLSVVSFRPVEVGRAAKGLIALLDMLRSGGSGPVPALLQQADPPL
jgi:signal transduction histidine kinase/CheY-like chemotaxis protein